MIEIQKDSYNKKRGEIMERLTNKQILLVIIFIVIMIASFIYSPWENDSAIVISSMPGARPMVLNCKRKMNKK